MNQIEKVDNQSALTYIDNELLKAVEDSIRKRHKKTQSKETNKNHIKQKAGMDYVEFSYMRNEVDENYPLWSLVDLKFYPEFIATGWVMVQGTLMWMEDGVVRKGSHATAHRMQFKSGATRTAENIVDLGNDVKAAVTDLLKKCFNTYLGISDDVYKNITVENCDKTHLMFLSEIIKPIEDDSIRDKFKKQLLSEFNSGNINSVTFHRFTANMKRQAIKYIKSTEMQEFVNNLDYDKYLSEQTGDVSTD